MVIGTSRCTHVLCYLFCWRDDRADPETPRDSRYSTTADASGAPAIRNARANARRRIASCAHFGMGCSHAPRPGRLPAASTVTAYLPFPVDTATTRSSSTANSRFRQPTHVRTGPSMRRCAETEISRWITAQFTFTQPVVRTTRMCPQLRPVAIDEDRPSAGRQDECLPVNQPYSTREFDGCACAPGGHGRLVDERIVGAHAPDDREPL
jgi:hypothetical protein